MKEERERREGRKAGRREGREAGRHGGGEARVGCVGVWLGLVAGFLFGGGEEGGELAAVFGGEFGGV